MSKEKISFLAVFVNVLLTVLKLAIGFISRSSGVLAEGIHSGMDIVSSGINYIGIRASRKPVDKRHPYGHYQSEVIAGFVITIILFLSALWIIYEAVEDFFIPKTLDITFLAIGVMLGSAIVNEVMARIKFRFGKKYDSISLIADASHSRVDVLTSVGVLIGLLLASYWVYADSIAATIIGLYVMWSSIKLGRKTTDSLLNVSAGEDVENKIRDIIKKENIVLSGLKTQMLGSEIFAELKIKLDSKLRVEDASRISKNLERKLMEAVTKLRYVVIQIESHDVRESFYKGRFGRVMRWGRMGGFGLGPSGECICPKCGRRVPHQRGIPCYRQRCPKCGTKMTRTRRKE